MSVLGRELLEMSINVDTGEAKMRKHNTLVTCQLLTAAVFAAALAITTSTTLADDTRGYVTVSLSGSTAMRNFLTADGSTWLTPGQTFTVGGVALSNSTLWHPDAY